MKVACIIWTHNPDINLFHLVLRRAILNTIKVYIIDNDSNNYEEIKRVSSLYSNVELYKLPKNLGVKALNIGLRLALKNEYEWVLILDDDSVLSIDAVKEILEKYEKLKPVVKQRIGVITITDLHSLPLMLRKWIHSNIDKVHGKFIVHSYPIIFSGSIIKTSVFLMNKNISINENLFLDHADTIFFNEIRRAKFYTLLYVKKKMNHRMGLRLARSIKFFGISLNRVTSPTRFYYIVRNSIYLMLRGKLSLLPSILTIASYVSVFFIPKLRKKYMKLMLVGISHGIFGKLGVIDIKNGIQLRKPVENI